MKGVAYTGGDTGKPIKLIRVWSGPDKDQDQDQTGSSEGDHDTG